MVAYNFAHHDARAIIFGVKRACLKPHGKRAHVEVGGTVHICCGNVPPDWSKSADYHRLIEAPCVRSDPVILTTDHLVRDGRIEVNPEFYRVLAQQEGFSDFGALQAAFDRRYGLPWEGQYVRWNPDAAEFRAQWPLIVKPPDEGAEADPATSN